MQKPILKFQEELITLDIEPYYESFLKSRLAGTSIEDKVRIMIGPAEESLERLHNEGKRFDFIFIDANKGGYPSYYKVASWSLCFLFCG